MLDDSAVDVTFISSLIQIFEDYLEDYKVKVGRILSKLIDKPSMQLLFSQYKGTNIVIEYFMC